MSDDSFLTRLVKARDLMQIKGPLAWDGVTGKPYFGNELKLRENLGRIEQIIASIDQVIISELQFKLQLNIERNEEKK